MPSKKDTKSITGNFKPGDHVYTLLRGSSLWFSAKVLDSLEGGERYRCKFEDGTVEELSSKYVCNEARFRSKSPSRRKSRSRSRGRSRSPSRKAKQSPSPTRKPRETKTPKSTPPRQTKTPSTPTRQSARIAEQAVVKDENEVKSTPKEKTETIKSVTTSNPVSKSKKHKYEFCGPFGVTFLILFLPALVLGLNLACTKASCSLRQLPSVPRTLSTYFSLESALAVVGWFGFQAIIAVLPVGRVVQGQPLKSGKRLSYRCNGIYALLLTLGLYGAATYYKCPVATFAYQHFFQMAAVSIAFSTLLSIFLFIRSSNLKTAEQSPAGNSGCTVYDFFMGRELNPRVGPLDLKFFCELRPGLIAWVILNLSFIAQSCTQNAGSPSLPLMLVAVFQTLYVADALWFEDAILSTMDITTEGFGFMLAFGDLAWVPFMYTLQGRYLLEHTQTWSYPVLAGFLLLNLVGYFIFRGSNSQKDRFRKNPHDPALAYLETLPTPSGKALLVSGWWGLCRHPNYLGDLIMSLAWSLPCGFNSVIPYFYPIYFFILLAHRSLRDDEACRQKHGAAWDRYCQRVKYRIIPYVF